MKIKRALFILAAAAVTVICAVIIVAGVGELLGRPEASDIRAEDPDESTDISGVRENEKGEAAMEPEGQEQENASRQTEDSKDNGVEEILQNMTIEEKAAQLFIVTPESLTGGPTVTEADDILEEAYRSLPAGGFIMMQGNIISPEQITELNSRLEEMSLETVGVIPFLSVDEEGGTVTRIASNDSFPVEDVGNMSEIGAAGDSRKAYEAGAYIGKYLRDYGFNLDFAPDADVWNNPENTVVRYRSFSSDPGTASEMTAAAVQGFHSSGIWTALKHFPGHGATAEDSHEGFAWSDRTLDELRQCEFLPFEAGIEAGSEFVMAGHISVPEAAGEDTPASLSEKVISGILRDELGYDGIVVTDAMNMGAVTEHYSSAESAVMAVQAGADVILMPSDLQSAYQGILDAVQEGKITEGRLDESVRRILELKTEKDI